MKKRWLADVPKPVRERYMRKRIHSWGARIVRAVYRRRLPRLERERRKHLDATFETVKYYAHRNENGPFPAITLLFNIGLYLLLAERDIQALKIDALTHPDEWTRKLHARVILLTIYEWDADKVSGRALKDALDAAQTPQHLRTQIVDVLRQLRAVQRKISKEFTFVRNAAIGHRDPNALLQYRAIRDLRTERVFQLAEEFYGAIHSFMPVLTELMLESGKLSSLLAQWSPQEG